MDRISNHQKQFGVLIIEPDTFRREGLIRCVEQDPLLRVVASGEDLVEMLDRLVLHRDNIEILILNGKHPEVGLPRFWTILRMSLPPKIGIMAIADGADQELLEFLFAVGVEGLFPPEVQPEELCEALLSVAAGMLMIHPLLAEQLKERLAMAPVRQSMIRDYPLFWDGSTEQVIVYGKRASLTPREREALVLVAQGATNKQIAEVLVITERTAAFHVSNILQKLGLSSRYEIENLVRMSERLEGRLRGT